MFVHHMVAKTIPSSSPPVIERKGKTAAGSDSINHALLHGKTGLVLAVPSGRPADLMEDGD